MGAIWDALKQGFKEGWSGKQEAREPNPRVTVTAKVSVSDDDRRRFAEAAQREQEVREGYFLRARALSDAGVNLEQFSEARAVNDALAIFGKIVYVDPVGWRSSLERAKASLNPQNLTKAGKVPKNVVEANLDGMPDFDTGVICHLKYMADGSINMADFHIWHNSVRHSVFVRTVDGEHRITAVEHYDMRRDFRKQLFSDKSPESNEEAVGILNHFLGQLAR